jgi:hypothetical protein
MRLWNSSVKVYSFEVWYVTEQMYTSVRELSSGKNRRQPFSRSRRTRKIKGKEFANLNWKTCSIAVLKWILKEMVNRKADWIQLTEIRVHWRVLVHKVEGVRSRSVDGQFLNQSSLRFIFGGTWRILLWYKTLAFKFYNNSLKDVYFSETWMKHDY